MNEKDKQLHEHVETTCDLARQLDRLDKWPLRDWSVHLQDIRKLAQRAHSEAHRLWKEYGFDEGSRVKSEDS